MSQLPSGSYVTIQQTDWQLPEIDGLEMAQGLKYMAESQILYLAVLKKFTEAHANTVSDIRLALAAGDDVTAGRLAHTLKGVAASIGATGLHDVAAMLEQMLSQKTGKEGGGSSAGTQLQLLELHLTALLSQLELRLTQLWLDAGLV